jgi:hypothetical protein
VIRYTVMDIKETHTGVITLEHDPEYLNAIDCMVSYHTFTKLAIIAQNTPHPNPSCMRRSQYSLINTSAILSTILREHAF